jgi:hypothetical protein
MIILLARFGYLNKITGEVIYKACMILLFRNKRKLILLLSNNKSRDKNALWNDQALGGR